MDDYIHELDLGDQEQSRLAKLNELRAMGIDPDPPRSHRTHTAKDAIAVYEEWEASEGSGARDQGSADASADQHSALSTQHSALPDPPHVTLVGRLRLRRTAGKATFAHIED